MNTLNHAPEFEDIPWEKICAILIHKLMPAGVPVVITPDDVDRLEEAFTPGIPILFTNTTKRGVEVSLITESEAIALARIKGAHGGH